MLPIEAIGEKFDRHHPDAMDFMIVGPSPSLGTCPMEEFTHPRAEI